MPSPISQHLQRSSRIVSKLHSVIGIFRVIVIVAMLIQLLSCFKFQDLDPEVRQSCSCRILCHFVDLKDQVPVHWFKSAPDDATTIRSSCAISWTLKIRSRYTGSRHGQDYQASPSILPKNVPLLAELFSSYDPWQARTILSTDREVRS